MSNLSDIRGAQGDAYVLPSFGFWPPSAALKICTKQNFMDAMLTNGLYLPGYGITHLEFDSSGLFGGSGEMPYANFQNNALDQDTVDRLVGLWCLATTPAELILDGGTNAVPTGTEGSLLDATLLDRAGYATDYVRHNLGTGVMVMNKSTYNTIDFSDCGLSEAQVTAALYQCDLGAWNGATLSAGGNNDPLHYDAKVTMAEFIAGTPIEFTDSFSNPWSFTADDELNFEDSFGTTIGVMDSPEPSQITSYMEVASSQTNRVVWTGSAFGTVPEVIRYMGDLGFALEVNIV